MLASAYYLRESTTMTGDPFSDILRLVNAQSVVSGGFTAGGPWAIRFPAFEKIKFSALVEGHCWLSIDGESEPLRVETGDVFLIAANKSFVLAGDLPAAPVEAAAVFYKGFTGMATLGDGADCVQIGGFIRLDPCNGELLLEALPPLIHVQAISPQATVLHWLLGQLIREQATDSPGASMASEQLAQLMFVQILRAHLEASGPLATGWLRAVADKQIAPSLRLMHGDPSRSWSLEELAKACAMSRTTFVVRFKKVAGIPPLAYLLNWRMRLAERALREGKTPLSQLAHSLGYTSESAFSNAFKRARGIAPKRYRDAVQTDPEPPAPAERVLKGLQPPGY
jgi:AraC-like DNA-binding protein